MDWKAEALARVRRARLQANNLRHEIDDITYSLHKLEGYDDEYTEMRVAIFEVNHIVEDLFRIEGKLSGS